MNRIVRRLRSGRSFLITILMTALSVTCSFDTKVDPPDSQSADWKEKDLCPPEEGEFQLVESPFYTGVIISPKYAIDHTSGHISGPSLSMITDFWQASPEDITRAEVSNLTYLQTANKNVALIPELASLDSDLQRHLHTQAAEILQHLPQYDRQYLGIVVNNHRLLFCSYVIHSMNLLEYWRCRYIYVYDSGSSVWRIYYDVVDSKSIGFQPNGA
jgi:hypothetical protein